MLALALVCQYFIVGFYQLGVYSLKIPDAYAYIQGFFLLHKSYGLPRLFRLSFQYGDTGGKLRLYVLKAGYIVIGTV